MGNKGKKKFEKSKQQAMDDSGASEEAIDEGMNQDKTKDEAAGELKQTMSELKENGGIDSITKLCGLDSSNLLNGLNEYINIAKSGYPFDNYSYYSYFIDIYRDKYKKHILQNETRYDDLLQSEKNYFNQKYGEKFYDALLIERNSYLIGKNKNNIGNINEILKSIYKSIYTNTQYDKQETIINNEIKKYSDVITNLNSNIDGIDTNVNIEKTKNNKKNEMFLKQISTYVYYVYIIYLTAFVINLIAADFTSVIFSFKNLSFIIFLYLLPGYIYPFFYHNLLLPIIFYIYNNNNFTKPYPIVAFDDISDQKFGEPPEKIQKQIPIKDLFGGR